jgi:hypothetical protein
MSTEEPLYRTGICPNCPPAAHSRLLFAEPEYQGADFEGGKLASYTEVNVLSLFRCEGCKSAAFYKTNVETGCSIEDIDCYDPGWAIKMAMSDEFRDLSTRIYYSPLFSATPQESLKEKPSSVPEKVRKIYEEALRVKDEPNSFAVQIRRALEAICIDRGEQGKNLNDDLIRLSEAGVFPPIVAEIAQELRDVGNTGAHAKPRDVGDEQVQAIDDFFNLVATYVYEMPASLEAYRKRLAPEIHEITSEEIPEITFADGVN